MKYIIIVLSLLLFTTPTFAQDNLVNLINIQRTHKLTENIKLNMSATNKACDMIKQNYWSHVDPQGRYSWYLFRQQGFYGYIGENIAKGYGSDQEIINGWLNSPTHRTVMLNTVYAYVGIGRCGNIVVAHFADR
jgi:uncharacterized protein YkwD